MLQFSQRSEGEVTVLSLAGRLDAITAPEIRPAIEELVEHRRGKVLIELSTLTMIDSSGVGAIVSLFKRLRAHSGDVKLSGLRGQPKEIFHLLRLDQVFDVYPTLDEALQRWR